MKDRKVVSQFLSAAFLLLLATAGMAAAWSVYVSQAYGFSMLVPTGTATNEKEWAGGWGGLTATHEGVKLFGLAKLGAPATDDEIEKFAIQTIGIPASGWKQIDQGSNDSGWRRYRTFEAMQGTKLVFGGYGVGPKGNYLLYLETTPADYNEYKADYRKWYDSIRLR